VDRDGEQVVVGGRSHDREPRTCKLGCGWEWQMAVGSEVRWEWWMAVVRMSACCGMLSNVGRKFFFFEMGLERWLEIVIG